MTTSTHPKEVAVRTSRSWRTLSTRFLVATLVLAGCGVITSESPDDTDDFDVTITLQNLDTPVIGQAVHLFGPGETFPTGRLEPGVSRVIDMTFSRGESATFQAGRNGSILTSRSCTCSNPGCEGDTQVRVEWNGSALSCVGW